VPGPPIPPQTPPPPPPPPNSSQNTQIPKRQTNPTNTPTDRGQGLNHSIVDAHHIVAAISEVQSGQAELPEAVSAYDKEMVTRCAEEVRLSVETGLMVHDWPRLMESGIMKHGLGKMS